MSPDEGFVEKRAYERVTGEFKVVVREMLEPLFQHLLEVGDYEETPLMELEEEEAVEGITSDVSRGGLGLMGDLRLSGGRPLKKGKRLFVECHLPDQERPLRALATVMWARPGEVPEAGLMFMGISRADLERLEAFIRATGAG